jgi:hypothetical protein
MKSSSVKVLCTALVFSLVCPQSFVWANLCNDAMNSKKATSIDWSGFAKRHHLKILGVVAGASLLSAHPAHAQQMTNTVQVTFPLSTTDYQSSLSLPGFNPNLGTLESITLTLNPVGNETTTFQSKSPSTIDFNLNLYSTLFLSLSTGQTYEMQGTLAQNYQVSPYSTVSQSQSVIFSDQSYQLTSGLNSFENGDVNLVLTTDNDSFAQIGGGGNYALTQDLKEGLQVDATFVYSVPEPSPLALSGAGALVLLAVRHHKNRR